MTAGDVVTATTLARPPRAMAWVVLIAAAVAVLVTGVAATAVIVGNLQIHPSALPPAFWLALVAACGLTAASLSLRSLRWVFLLRRSGTRIPIRDAYIGYFAGLSLLFAPFLLGEIAVRAVVQRSRAAVPIGTTVAVNLWERLLDLAALGAIAGLLGLASGRVGVWTVGLVAGSAATLAAPVRRGCLRVAVAAGRWAARLFDGGRATDCARLAGGRTWVVALAASIVAWALPGLGFWLLAAVWQRGYSPLEAEYAYASAASLGGLVLAPGGVLVAGGGLLAGLEAEGFDVALAALTVVAARLATVGVATALGCVFLLVHRGSAPASSAAHFDEIADAYDVQIPESRREALLARKTSQMRDALDRLGQAGAGTRGLDIGCGQGAYVVRMRELGFDVRGLDSSSGQVAMAARRVGAEGLVSVGSVLDIPAADASYDFVYVINVLHHLGSLEEQRQAFREIARVLRPGGVLFVHEINTRNILFRFYMGYVFPSLNCIDEGVERWLLPTGLAQYTELPVVDIRYFTFLPDFVPEAIVRLLRPVERRLEGSSLGGYSAHYMAVLRKPGADPVSRPA